MSKELVNIIKTMKKKNKKLTRSQKHKIEQDKGLMVWTIY
jgi:hypothetical protein